MNEDQKEKAINIAQQQVSGKNPITLITDMSVNEKGEISVTYDDGKSITLNSSMLDNDNTVTSSAITGANSVSYTITDSNSVSYINGYCDNNINTGIYYPYPWTASSSSWNSATAPVSNKKYFIEDKANFSWIVSKFMKTYVSNLNNTSTLETIGFFGLKNGEEKSLSLTLKAINTSVKEFFELAVTTAKQNSFDELFGPLTDELTEEDYIERAEDSGLFIKDLYDEKSLIELVKTHKIEISKKINHKNRQRALTGVLEDDDDDENWFSKAPWDITTSKIDDNIEILKKGFEEDNMSDLWRDPRTFLAQTDYVKYHPSSISSNINFSTQVTSAI